jgi:hypothetical protein
VNTIGSEPTNVCREYPIGHKGGFPIPKTPSDTKTCTSCPGSSSTAAADADDVDPAVAELNKSLAGLLPAPWNHYDLFIPKKPAALPDRDAGPGPIIPGACAEHRDEAVWPGKCPAAL